MERKDMAMQKICKVKNEITAQEEILRNSTPNKEILLEFACVFD